MTPSDAIKTPLMVLLPIVLGVLIGVGGYTFWYAKGYSYLLNDPKVCVNCHVMQDNYDSWTVSSHRSATCNDCHVPHDLIGKYISKADNGFRHGWAFTFKDNQVIRITDHNRDILNHNCVYCHEATVTGILSNKTVGQDMNCVRCHKGVGHGF